MNRNSALIAAASLFALSGRDMAATAEVVANPPTKAVSAMVQHTRYNTVDVGGVKVFYREAGKPSSPTLVLLHGNPSSSFMFRDLIPLLAGRFHVIAPDYPGFGYSEAPPPESYTYTFEHLAQTVDTFLTQIGATEYILYMQDYGGPIGMRLATAHPDRVRGIIIQNANAYLEGLPAQWRAELEQQIKDAAEHPGGPKPPKHKPPSPLEENLKWTKGMYVTGAREAATMSPDGYTFDAAMLSRSGQDEIQDVLGDDYYRNVLLYPTWQAWLRQHHPRVLIAWGHGDQIFGPVAAEAYKRDVPQAKLVFYNGGHFVLEEYAPEVAREIIATFSWGDGNKIRARESNCAELADGRSGLHARDFLGSWSSAAR
jgi:pimeloyl-ACP methyl ester carboxylesterase